MAFESVSIRYRTGWHDLSQNHTSGMLTKNDGFSVPTLFSRGLRGCKKVILDLTLLCSAKDLKLMLTNIQHQSFQVKDHLIHLADLTYNT